MPAKEAPVCCTTAVVYFGTMALNFRFEHNGFVWKKNSDQTAILDTGENPEPRLFAFYTPVVPCHRCVCRQ